VSSPSSRGEKPATSPEVERFNLVEYVGAAPTSAVLQGLRGFLAHTPNTWEPTSDS
jgi:hypothetical protein